MPDALNGRRGRRGPGKHRPHRDYEDTRMYCAECLDPWPCREHRLMDADLYQRWLEWHLKVALGWIAMFLEETADHEKADLFLSYMPTSLIGGEELLQASYEELDRYRREGREFDKETEMLYSREGPS